MRWDLDLNPAVCSLRRTILNGFRYRVAAPSIRIVPWAALASCWPLPQQLLPVSAAGGGRRCCSGRIILIFGIAERLRTLRYPIFTGGVVMASGICSACFLRKRRRCGEATSPSPSAHYVRIHLSQGERPWQRDKVCVDCQGLSLWESCQSRQALTERARTLRDQREQTEGVFPGRQALTEGVPL